MKIRPEFDKVLIGKNLRRYRLLQKLSVEEVRKYLQIGSQQAIYKWEEGACYPQADTLLVLMQLYGIEVNDLISEEISESDRDAISCKLKTFNMDYQSQAERVRKYYLLIA